MTSQGFLLVFHGCDATVGELILQGKDHVRSSSNKHDWLGSGAYFWENSPIRALQWAKFLQSHPQLSRTPIKTPFVVGAILNPGRCLDLTEVHSLGLLKDAYCEFRSSLENINLPLPVNEKGHSSDEDLVKRYLDCAVIEFLHVLQAKKERPPFDSVRGAFFEGGDLYPGARISAKTHIQWCVRNAQKSIVGYFRVTSTTQDL